MSSSPEIPTGPVPHFVNTGPQARAQRSLRVLMVEDDAHAARLIRRRLQWSSLARFEVTHASDLASGLALLEREAFDAVLLDLSLPDATGLVTLGSFSLLTGELPVLVLTGEDDDLLAFQAIRFGAQGYLIKDREDGRSLARAVVHACQRHHRHAAGGMGSVACG